MMHLCDVYVWKAQLRPLSGSGIGSVGGFPLKWLVGSKLFPETSKCQNEEIFCLGLLHFFSKKSSDVFVWKLDAVSDSLGVGGKGIKA